MMSSSCSAVPGTGRLREAPRDAEGKEVVEGRGEAQAGCESPIAALAATTGWALGQVRLEMELERSGREGSKAGMSREKARGEWARVRSWYA